MRVGLVGLGDMGLRIAKCLIRDGHEVLAYDIREASLQQANAAGACAVRNIEEILSETTAIGVVVLNDEQVTKVVDGPNGLLAGMVPQQTLIIHSTILPSTVIDLAGKARARGISILDAPVSGAGVRADAGELAVLVGGDINVVEGCRPLLQALGAVHYLGPVGAGQAVKLANNMVVATTKGAIYEALALTRAYGIDDDKVVDALLEGSAASFLLEHWSLFEGLLVNHTLAKNPDFTSFMTKDVWSAVLAAHEKHLDLPIAAVAATSLASKLRTRIAELNSKAQ